MTANERFDYRLLVERAKRQGWIRVNNPKEVVERAVKRGWITFAKPLTEAEIDSIITYRKSMAA